MTKTKKTLGRNLTRYHNWYGMNNVLEAACSGQLHWTRETIRRYTLDHAPEVNQGSAQHHTSQPPPLPGNDGDDWFKCHPKLPGSGKAPRKPTPAKAPTKSTKGATGGTKGKKLTASQGGQKKKPHRYHPGTVALRDPEVPEVDGAPHSEAAFPEVGAGDCSESDQGRHPFSERGHHGTARGLGGLLSGSP